MPDMKKYVLFEGVDGSGKTKLAADVGMFLRVSHQQDPLVTREPGSVDDKICTQIREMLKSGSQINRSAEVLLFMADRAQHTEFVIKPALASGRIVLQDRGFLSTYAYQGFGRSWDRSTIKLFNRMSATRPDLIVMMITDLEVAWARIQDRQKDQFEAKYFQQRVQSGFNAAMNDAADPMFSSSEEHSAWPWQPPPILFIDGANDHARNIITVTNAILGLA